MFAKVKCNMQVSILLMEKAGEYSVAQIIVY